LITPAVGELLKDKLRDHSQFELYLLRARYYSNHEWRLRGFRLIRIGNDKVGLGASLDRSLEQEVILNSPAGLVP
jgi:hypothetical protein